MKTISKIKEKSYLTENKNIENILAAQKIEK